MPEFLIELYMARSDADTVVQAADRATAAAARLRRDGACVHYLRSIFVPDDETCFLVFAAGSADEVRRAAGLAGLPADRVVEALEAEAR